MTADIAVDTGILIKWVIEEADSRLAEGVATSVLACSLAELDPARCSRPVDAAAVTR